MMSMNFNSEPIHKWDSKSLLRAFLFGVAIETAAIAPAILSPWGHAGPESTWGWLGLMLNAPGLFVVWLLRSLIGSTETVSLVSGVVYVYSIQTLIFSYVAFVWFRSKKRRVKLS